MSTVIQTGRGAQIVKFHDPRQPARPALLTPLKCRHCGKPFKGRGWLTKHEAACTVRQHVSAVDSVMRHDECMSQGSTATPSAAVRAFKIYANDIFMRLDYDFCLDLAAFIRDSRTSNRAIAEFGRQLESDD